METGKRKHNIVTLSAKTSLMIEVHKAGFCREGHIILGNQGYMYVRDAMVNSAKFALKLPIEYLAHLFYGTKTL